VATNKASDVDIDGLKAALTELRALKSRMGGGTGGAYATLGGAADISADLGPLIDGAGPQMAAYYTSHATAVRNALLKAGSGVAMAEALLEAAIANFETADHRAADAASRTATGGGVTAARGVG
jgi:hypothetical protein